MSTRHPLIAIEGIDGAGKSTQLAILAKSLGAQTVKFPNYDSPTGEIILRLLQKPNFELDPKTNAYILQSLMTVNRLEAAGAITAALLQGPVILDRYFASGMVYGQYDGLALDWLTEIHRLLPAPDLYILLDIGVQTSFRRRPKRDDAYESDQRRLAAVRTHYVNLWETPPDLCSDNGLPTRWCQVDGSAAPYIVTTEIESAVRALLKDLNP